MWRAPVPCRCLAGRARDGPNPTAAQASKAPPGRARKPYWPATSPVRKRLATASRVTIGDPRSSLAARPEQLDVSSLRRQLEAAALSRRQEAMRLEDARRCAQAQHAEALATREELQRGQRRAEAMAAERDAAMRDVEELRRQVDELQAEVAELRGKSEVPAPPAPAVAPASKMAGQGPWPGTNTPGGGPDVWTPALMSEL